MESEEFTAKVRAEREGQRWAAEAKETEASAKRECEAVARQTRAIRELELLGPQVAGSLRERGDLSGAELITVRERRPKMERVERPRFRRSGPPVQMGWQFTTPVEVAGWIVRSWEDSAPEFGAYSKDGGGGIVTFVSVLALLADGRYAHGNDYGHGKDQAFHAYNPAVVLSAEEVLELAHHGDSAIDHLKGLAASRDI